MSDASIDPLVRAFERSMRAGQVRAHHRHLLRGGGATLGVPAQSRPDTRRCHHRRFQHWAGDLTPVAGWWLGRPRWSGRPCRSDRRVVCRGS